MTTTTAIVLCGLILIKSTNAVISGATKLKYERALVTHIDYIQTSLPPRFECEKEVKSQILHDSYDFSIGPVDEKTGMLNVDALMLHYFLEEILREAHLNFSCQSN